MFYHDMFRIYVDANDDSYSVMPAIRPQGWSQKITCTSTCRTKDPQTYHLLNCQQSVFLLTLCRDSVARHLRLEGIVIRHENGAKFLSCIS